MYLFFLFVILVAALIISKIKANNVIIAGSLIADAASLGLHWLYDTEKLAEVIKTTPIAFHEINENDYKDVMGYFAWKGKATGDSSL